MTVIKCPTNCEHEYEFPHSLIIATRTFMISNIMYQEGSIFIVCRTCFHWIDGHVVCNCACHEEPGGTTVVQNELYRIE